MQSADVVLGFVSLFLETAVLAHLSGSLLSCKKTYFLPTVQYQQYPIKLYLCVISNFFTHFTNFVAISIYLIHFCDTVDTNTIPLLPEFYFCTQFTTRKFVISPTLPWNYALKSQASSVSDAGHNAHLATFNRKLPTLPICELSLES